MESFLLLVMGVVIILLLNRLQQRLRHTEEDLSNRQADHQRYQQLLTQLEREQTQLLREHGLLQQQVARMQRELLQLRQTPPAPVAAAPPIPPAPLAVVPEPPVVAAEPAAPEPAVAPETVAALTPAVAATPAPEPPVPVAEPEPAATEPASAPEPVVAAEPVLTPEPALTPELTTAPEPVAAEPVTAVEPAEAVAPEPASTPEPVPTPEAAPEPVPAAAVPEEPVQPEVTPEPVPEPAAPLVEPEPVPEPESAPESAPEPVPTPPLATPPPPPRSPQPPRPVPRPAMPRPRPVPVEPAGPSWWERVSAVVLENWTGILGAVILVTGVGFLGIYAALRIAPIYRFLLINGFALSLLGTEYYLRRKPFAAQLAVWLQSSAAAIFLFTCVGAVSIPGLRWAAPPFDYLLLFVGAGVNLWLAWRSSQEAVATLHGLLSLVALAVLPPTLLTLAAAAAVTAFAIGITYRQRWRFQLLLSILSFFAFHVYWHSQLTPPVGSGLRLGAIGLVLLVGLAAAVVQYRRVYASGRFEALLFAAHVLNWTCLGINLYLHSTGSVWKTIPLGLGAVVTFLVARHARRLGIQWLFQTDTVISLILALATAFSLQGWHASVSFILVVMLLESLLVAFIMAREGEGLVFQVAAVGALLAGGALLLTNIMLLPGYSPAGLHRNAALLALAAAAGAVYFHLARTLPLLTEESAENTFRQQLYRVFGGLVGALYAGAVVLVLRALFWVPQPPVLGLTLALVAAAGGVLALAHWLRHGVAWFRQLHLLVAQVLLTVAVLGLHELGLSWPVTLLLLYAETLTAALLLGRFREPLVQSLVTGAALFTGGLLLVDCVLRLPELSAAGLYQRAGWLLLAAVLGAAFSRLTDAARPTHSAFGPLPAELWLAGGALIAAHYTGLALLLLDAFFGPAPTLAAGLLGGTVAAAGVAFGLSRWLRGGTEWLRQLHLLAGQLLLTVAVLGLHELGLSWPATLLVLYAETLLMTLLLGRFREPLVQRILTVAAQLTGALLLLSCLYQLPSLSAAGLYRRALWLLLAAALGAIGNRLTDPGRNPAFGQLPGMLWLLGGIQVGAQYAGLLLVLLQAFFGPAPTSAAGLLTGCVAAAGLAFGLSQWLRGGTEWLRQLHLLATQALLTVAVLGLHEIGLSWSATLLVLYAETLTAALLLGRFREPFAQRIVAGAALLTGGILLVDCVGMLTQLTATGLYRRATWLLLAGVLGAVGSRLTDSVRTPAPAFGRLPDVVWLLGRALVGLQYAGLLLLLGQGFFGPVPTSAAGLLGGTLAAAGIVFGLGQWLRGGDEWLRRLHVLTGQLLLMLAALGLHELGLSWPAAVLILYLETLLMTLLLAARREWLLYRVLLIGTLLLVPVLVAAVLGADSRAVLGDTPRAALLVAAALATAAAQAWLTRMQAPATDTVPLAADPAYRLRLLGLAAGLLPLMAGLLVYRFTWSASAVVAVVGGLLVLRRLVPVPGLWLGLLTTSVGFLALQWLQLGQHPASIGRSLLYLLPTALLPLIGVQTSWWAARERHVRWPWLYLLGLHLPVAAWLTFHSRSDAAPALLWTLLAAGFFGAAQLLRPYWPDSEQSQRAGQPARYLLHLSYALLAGALLYHLGPMLISPEYRLGWPARRFTAAALLLVLGYFVLMPPPAETTYRSWRYLHPWLPEVALLLLGFTLHWETHLRWHAPLWIGLALLLAAAGPQLPARLRRVQLYALPLFWLATLTIGYVSVRYLRPGQWLTADWLATAGATALLFVFAALVLWRIPATEGLQWPPGLGGLAALGRLRFRQLVPMLLYPAFVALALLLVQSFDRSVLTVLLMLEVMAVFVSSLLLRRRDLRYVALAGIGGCMVRLVFFDLKQRGTITQAVVFIFMGLLLLGMNALYARFKGRFATPDEPEPEEFAPDDSDTALTP